MSEHEVCRVKVSHSCGFTTPLEMTEADLTASITAMQNALDDLRKQREQRRLNRPTEPGHYWVNVGGSAYMVYAYRESAGADMAFFYTDEYARVAQPGKYLINSCPWSWSDRIEPPDFGVNNV